MPWSGNPLSGYTGNVGDTMQITLQPGQILSSNDLSICTVTVGGLITAIGVGVCAIDSNIFVDGEFWPTRFTIVALPPVIRPFTKSFPPKVFNVRNPAGFDLEIAHMQTLLAQLTFIDTIFGRALVQQELLSKSEAESAKNPALGLRGRDLYTRRFPQGRKLNQDIDLTYSDQFPSMLYFYITAPADTNKKNWTYEEGQLMITQPFSLMFWADLKKLETNSGEQLKIAILSQLLKMNNLKVTRLFETYDTVLSDFTLTGNLQQFCKFPHYALRIEADSSYPALPENGNGDFDPNSLVDISRLPLSQPGSTNVN